MTVFLPAGSARSRSPSGPVRRGGGTALCKRLHRARWTIEEWHKALKTGCRIEDRQLETWERMEVLLSICSVIGWKVLQLRHLARGRRVPPDFFLTDAERTVLKEKYPELGSQGGKDRAIAIAKMGGYLDRSSNPPPAGRRCGRD